jgi:tetratricopeptide (TPR) repeat protein
VAFEQELSEVLFVAWQHGPNPEDRDHILSTYPVPGSVALHGRYHFLTDDVPEMPETIFRVEREIWDAQIELTTLSDAALVANDVAEADELLEKLEQLSSRDLHPLPLVDARIGRADSARQADRFDHAAELYAQALELAQSAHYRFGRIRALVSVGYLTMQAGAVHQALQSFDDASALARELDERLYLANALTGQGEALGRLRRDEEAVLALGQAVDLFESLQSHVGSMNAAQHLGDLLRRRGDLEPAQEILERALATARGAGAWIGEVNALDALGEVLLVSGEIGEAVQYLEEAYKLSEGRAYLRGQAHAANGLGRCASAVSEWELSRDLHEAALSLYQQIEDLQGGASVAMGHQAKRLHQRSTQ